MTDGEAAAPSGAAARTLDDQRDAADVADLTPRQLAVLQAAVLVVALCGIAYELVIATVASYLLGDSVAQFSITIGLFMFAMGIGSYASKWVRTRLVERFIIVEVLVSLAGGLASSVLFALFPWDSFFRPAMYGMILLIGALVGLEIPLLTRILAASRSLRSSIAQVLSLDYIGALIGSVSFPLLLLPTLGLFRASFAFGLLNIAVAAMTVGVFSRRLERPGRWWAVVVVGIATLVLGMASGERITRFAEDRLFAHDVIHREQTPYQRIVVTREQRNGRLRMYLDGHLQFAERDEYRYHEALVHPVMSLPGPRARVLLLGAGDGLAARELLRYADVERIDLVDIDPGVTRLCREFAPLARLNGGSLDDPRVAVHHEDAFAFVQEVETPYDRVIIDLPDPHNEALSKLYSIEFYRMVARSARPDAWIVTQASSPFLTREAFWCTARTLEAAGWRVLPFHVSLPSFGQWGFVLAGQHERPPTRFALQVETRALDADSLAAATVFARDTGPLDGPVNSIFEPQLYRLYRIGETR